MAEIQSIKVAYEELDMSPEEIATDRELDVVSVKAALMQSSAKYRRACGAENTEDTAKLNFTDNDLEAANDVIRNLALYSEDDHLRFKAATYIRDDKKGRKEVVKLMSHGPHFNILMFNEQMAKIREVAEKAKQRVIGNGHTVEV